jgi:hypothetical protein
MTCLATNRTTGHADASLRRATASILRQVLRARRHRCAKPTTVRKLTCMMYRARLEYHRNRGLYAVAMSH